MQETENDILKRVRKIEIKTRGLSNEIFAGKYHTAFRGRGMSFSEVREYRAGDDVRDIDWNVTARSRKPHIKVYEEERELTMMLLVDVSASRMFGSTDRLKKNIITEIAAVLAFSAAQNNDKVGCIFFSDRVEKFIPPKKGRSHILMIIRELIGFRPESAGTKLSEPVRFLTNVNKKRCTTFILSDFMDSTGDKSALDDALKIAGSKHDLVGIRVYDPRETELPDVGIVELKDAESGRKVWVDTSSRAVRDHYAASWQRRSGEAQAQPHRHGDDLDRRRLCGRIDKTVQTAMKRLFAIALLFAGLAAQAQETPTVTARVEPDSIMIGDRFDYVIDVEKDLVQVVEFPVFDPRDGKIELVENCPVDTLERDGRRLKLRKRYRLAAFDEGKYNLGAAQVLYADKNILDTLRSTDSVYLEVATFQIDSTSQSIYDLKAQKNLPFRFREVSGYVKWGVFFLLMLLAAGYALKRYLASRGKGFGDLFKPAPPLPPHVAAIQALEALHNQKLWQNNRHKQYYSGLTDILRTYIAARWGFGAMEMTSDEIIETMRPEELPDKARMDLTAILRDADLVKFAKATPEAEQNEADYLKAYYFVEETKPVEEEAPAEEESPKQN